MPTPHKHAALIKQWAEDPNQEVWFWSNFNKRWELSTFNNMVAYTTGGTYALGPKPTQPPYKMCVLAGAEFPMPETSPPEPHKVYYMPNIYHTNEVSIIRWEGDRFDMDRLSQGFVHLNRDAAHAHAIALAKASKQAIENAK